MLMSVRLLAEILLLVVTSVSLCSHVMQLVAQLSMSGSALQTKEMVSPINAIVLSDGSIFL